MSWPRRRRRSARGSAWPTSTTRATRTVLEEAARRFGWRERVRQKEAGVGIGLACGTEKGSYVAACVEVAVDAADRLTVRRVCQVFEGAAQWSARQP
ncbi:MAG: hypothetical protein HS113_25590 [Verrucomicrobiales bacterium]|nr:hypothetical protein [Verrucomicrobiales bacterium]